MEKRLRADLRRRVRNARTENVSQPTDEEDQDEQEDDDDGDQIKLGAADKRLWRDDLQGATVMNVTPAGAPGRGTRRGATFVVCVCVCE